MQNMASESATKRKILLPVIGGVVIVALIIIMIILSTSQKKQTLAYEATFSEITQIANTLTANAEMTQAIPSATPTLVEEQATETVVEPTQTVETSTTIVDVNVSDPVQIQFVCMDNDFDFALTNYDSFDQETTSYHNSDINGNDISVAVPALACMVVVESQDPISEGSLVALYQNRDPVAWYQKVLQPVDGKTNTYYAILDHQYVIDPPYWSLTYGLKIENNESIYWEGQLILTRSYPGLCWEGSTPDPVTLACPYTDVLEREPHYDMPTLVPGGLPK